MKTVLVPLIAALGSASECRFSLQVLQLQDGSYSFEDDIDRMSSFMSDLIASLDEDYPGLKFGISSFVDKPIPISGYGDYGNNPGVRDYCYRQHQALTSESQAVVGGLQDLYWRLGDGNDFPENPLEALILAALDPSVGWAATDLDPITHTPYLRVIILITDDLPHLPGEGTVAIDWFWNYERGWDEEEHYSQGGFGSHMFANHGQVWLGEDNSELPLYNELADLYYILDHNETLNDQQQERFQTLLKKFGPAPWPTLLPHPGDDSLPCNLTDYPSPEQVGKVLREKQIFPIFLTSGVSANSDLHSHCADIGMEEDIALCLSHVYADLALQMNITATTSPITSENTLEKIKHTISILSEKICQLQPTESPSTEPETSTHPLTSTISTTLMESTFSDTVAVSTDELSHVTEETVLSLSNKVTFTAQHTDELITTPFTDPHSSSDQFTSLLSTSAVSASESAVLTTNELMTTSSVTTIDLSAESFTTSGLSTIEPPVFPPATMETGSMHSAEMTTTDRTIRETTAPIPTGVPSSVSVTQTEMETITYRIPGSDSETSTSAMDEDKTEGVGGGPGIGVMAGAAAGAVGGLAALGGAVYGMGGMSALGSAPAEAIDTIQQVEVPETTIEREVMEEITTNLFQ